MEGDNVVLRVLTGLVLKLRDIGGVLGGHMRPCKVVSDRVGGQSG